jgi:CNT family concentrative nucleoside transporter
MSAKAVIIATYALCGFSNFASIGIQIGGIGALAPNRQSDLASLGIRALIVGSVACFMTATIAGMMFGGTP